MSFFIGIKGSIKSGFDRLEIIYDVLELFL